MTTWIGFGINKLEIRQGYVLDRTNQGLNMDAFGLNKLEIYKLEIKLNNITRHGSNDTRSLPLLDKKLASTLRKPQLKGKRSLGTDRSDDIHSRRQLIPKAKVIPSQPDTVLG